MGERLTSGLAQAGAWHAETLSILINFVPSWQRPAAPRLPQAAGRYM